MDNHAEKLTRQVKAETDDEVDAARRLRDLGYLSGGGLRDRERAALRRMVLNGRATDDLTSARRYTLTAEGLAWLEKQEGR